jgi:hypothetical protein
LSAERGKAGTGNLGHPFVAWVGNNMEQFGDSSTRLQRYCEPLRHPKAPDLSLAGVRLIIADHAKGVNRRSNLTPFGRRGNPRCGNDINISSRVGTDSERLGAR